MSSLRLVNEVREILGSYGIRSMRSSTSEPTLPGVWVFAGSATDVEVVVVDRNRFKQTRKTKIVCQVLADNGWDVSSPANGRWTRLFARRPRTGGQR